MRQFGLDHDFGLARVGHVESGEVLRCGLVRKPEDATLVARDLHTHAFADAAESLQFVVREEPHVQGERLLGAGSASRKR